MRADAIHRELSVERERGVSLRTATVRASTVLDLFTRECLAMTQVLEFFGGDDWDVLECHDFAAIGLIAERMA